MSLLFPYSKRRPSTLPIVLENLLKRQSSPVFQKKGSLAVGQAFLLKAKYLLSKANPNVILAEWRIHSVAPAIHGIMLKCVFRTLLKERTLLLTITASRNTLTRLLRIEPAFILFGQPVSKVDSSLFVPIDLASQAIGHVASKPVACRTAWRNL